MRWSPAGVCSFFQADSKSASVCRHTRHGWRRSTACSVHKSTRCSAWCYLSLYFYFQLYFIFLTTCQLREGVDQKLSQVLSFSWFVTLWYSCYLNRGLVRRGEDVELTSGVHLSKEIVQLMFVNNHLMNHSKKKKKKRVLTVLLYGIPRELQY